MKISIIIPAHNEEERIERTLQEYGKFFRNKKKNGEISDFEVLVVINNTQDKTEMITQGVSRKYNEIKYLNLKQGGKGFAIVEGFKNALKRDFDLIGFVDADMATSPKEFYKLIEKIKSYGGAIASRRKDGAVIKNKSFIRKITSCCFNFAVRCLFIMPYRDTQCGAKLFKREVIKEIIPDLKSMKWAFDIDLLYNARKRWFKIIEIPTVWEEKSGSKLNLKKVPLQMFSAIMRLRLLYSPFRGVVRLYNQLPERIKIHNL